MRVVVLLPIILLLQFGIGMGEQSKLEQEYLTTYHILNYSGRIERDGYTGLAYTLYRDSLNRLVALHEKGGMEQKVYLAKVAELQAKIADLKLKLSNSDLPPPTDSVYQEFLKLALAEDQFKQVNVNKDLACWTEFQGKHPQWQSRLISKFILDDRHILERARADRPPGSH